MGNVLVSGDVDAGEKGMSCPQIFASVQSGPYAGFSLAEMETEFERYKAALKESGSRLVGAQVQGESFQFGPRSDWSLAQWGKAVRFALAQVSPDFIAPKQTILVRFGGC